MFQRSLKKQEKFDALRDFLGEVNCRKCLLATCGDNNGALNWHFRKLGGHWTWADVSEENLVEMSDFLGESVLHIPEEQIPIGNEEFDIIVSIDVLEHLDGEQRFLGELRRVLRPGGQIIVTVPNGDPKLLANRIKWRLGMTPEVYGHTRAGYTVAELRDSMVKAGFAPVGHGGYSRFLTEMMELIINFGYVFVLSRKKGNAGPGQIAPTSAGALKTHGAAYRMYSLVFPIMRLVSKLDLLLPARTNNAVIVSGRKPVTEPS
jgi:SAM-dependent methyltransferase